MCLPHLFARRPTPSGQMDASESLTYPECLLSGSWNQTMVVNRPDQARDYRHVLRCQSIGEVGPLHANSPEPPGPPKRHDW